MHDIRVTKGEAVYTTSFTPPDKPMTAGSNTKLLALRGPTLIDESSNVAIGTIANGDPVSEPFGPYDYSPYSSSSHGASAYFDGSGDYLEVNGSTDFEFGTGDFTVECWMYFSAITTSALQVIFSSGTDSNAFFFHADADQLSVGTTSAFISNQTTTFSSGQWYHVAACRSGTTLRLFKNGTQVGSSVTDSTDWQQGGNARVGANMSAGQAVNGYISDLRVVKGTAVYTSDFAPPTTPLTAVTNTSLLLPLDDAGIIDKSQSVKTLTLNGGVKSSTSEYKFLTSSMYFDGTDDYIATGQKLLPVSQGIDYTVEGWFWATDVSDYYPIISQYTNGSDPERTNILIRPNDLHFFISGTSRATAVY